MNPSHVSASGGATASGAPGPVPGPLAAADAHAAAIAAAKRRWLQACGDGSSPMQVQALYEAYRELVISRVAAVVQGRTAAAS